MPAHNEAGLLDQTLKELVSALRDRDLAFEVLVVENGSTDSTLADAAGVRGRRRRGRGAHSPRRRLRRGHARRDPRGAPATSSWCSTSTTTTPTSSTACSRRLTGAGRSGDRRRVEARTRAPRDTRPWPRRAITAGFATVLRVGLRAHGVRHARHEGDATRRRSSRSCGAAGTAPTSSTPSWCCAADRAGLDGRRGAGDGRGAATVAHADRPPHRAHDGRAGAPADPALARAVGPPVTAPRFAAALSEHPVASHAVGEVAGEIIEAFGGDEPDLVVLLRVAALRRRDGRPRVRARQPARAAGDARRDGGGASSAAPARWRTGPRSSVFAASLPRRRAHAGGARRRAHARRRHDHGLARARPATRRPCCSSPTRSPSRVDGFLAPPRRRPSRPPGDRRRGVGGAGPGRQPARARRRRVDDRRRGRRVRRRASPCATVVSQGCRPVGEPYVVTRGEGNRIEELAGRAGDRPGAGHRGRRERGGPRPDASGPAPRPRGRRAPGRLRPRRLPRAQRARRRSRAPARSSSATTSPSARPCSSTSATRPRPTRTCARCSPATTPRPRCSSRATGAGSRFFGEPDHDAGVVDQLLGPLPGRGRVLRRRDRARRWAELPPRLHRQPRVVLTPYGVRPDAVGWPGARRSRRRGAMATHRHRRPSIEQRGINVIRGLAMDAVQKANSGHPGTPMALAPLAHVLFDPDHELRRQPRPTGPTATASCCRTGTRRCCSTRCSTSPASASTLDDLREFRQWGSKTAGHPEYRHAAGIEVTTGPLGQGFANGVGIGLAEANLRARFGEEVVDHHTFVFCGDGDLEEGVSHEAASIAGPPRPRPARLRVRRQPHHHRRPHRARPTPTTCRSASRATAGTSCSSARSPTTSTRSKRGLREGMAETDRPSLVVLRSHIGYPSPKYTDTAKAHGSPLGADEVAAVKEILGLPPEDFYVPDDVLEYYREAGARGRAAREEWEQRRRRVRRRRSPSMAARARRVPRAARASPAGSRSSRPGRRATSSPPARRAARSSTRCSTSCPGWSCGGADLTEQHRHGARRRAASIATHEFGGRQLHFGIREHGMGAVMNGMAVSVAHARGRHLLRVQRLHARARCGSPRCRSTRSLFVWTHDSVGPRRGRPDPPADRAARGDAGDAGAAGDPSRRCQRGGAGVAGPRRRRRAHRARSSPARSSRCSARTAERAPEGVPRGAYTLVDEERRRPRPRAHRHRFRGVVVRRRARPARRPARCGWCRCRRGTSSPRSPTTTASRCCRPTCRRSRSRPAPPSAGSATPTTSVGIDHFGASAPGPVVLDRVRLHPGARRRARPRCSWRTEQPDHVQRHRPPRTTSGRAPGTTTSPVRCSPAAGWRSWSRTTASAASRRTPRSSTRPSAPARATTSSSPQLRAGRPLDRGHLLGGRARRHRAATDVLRPVYDAHGRRRRLRVGRGRARRSRTTPTAPSPRPDSLHGRVDRPNVMIKIPATLEGIPAIEETIAAGITVNVTLIFSLDRHAQVIEAYLTGLERLVASGRRPVDGRVGGVVLREPGRHRDRPAPARRPARCGARPRSPTPSSPTSCSESASPAPAGMRSRPRARGCSGRCGRRRRPRTPRTPPTLYVDELIGPDTVNTLAPASIEALQRGEGDQRAGHRHRGRRRRAAGDGRPRRRRRRLRRRHRHARARGRRLVRGAPSPTPSAPSRSAAPRSPARRSARASRERLLRRAQVVGELVEAACAR